MRSTRPPSDSAINRFRRVREIRTANRAESALAERQLILLSAGTADRRLRMRETAARLAAEVDWARLAVTLQVRKLLPTLGPRIVELAKGGAPDSFTADVERALATGRRQGTLLQLVCARATDELAKAGIRSTPLKGPLLADALYGDIGRRISTDVDLLVAPENLYEAVDVVRKLGYSAPADHVEESGLPTMHFALPHERNEWPPVEIHWRIHWYERNFARERLLPPDPATVGSWRPAPADEFAMLLLFYSRDGFVDLRLASDLGAWWDSFGQQTERDAVQAVLAAYPALAPALKAAAIVAEETVGLPAKQLVGDGVSLRVRERMAIRLANPNPRSRRSQLHADMGLVDWLLMPPGGFREFVRRQVLLPREVFDNLSRQTPGWRSKSPLRHGAHILARYGLATIRVVRKPETLPDDG
jgi:hypothetical protein